MHLPIDRRPGVTLIELLVVISILLLLAGITVPAVQYARESARVVRCANNLRAYGTAMHSFQSGHGRFPSGIAATVTGPLAKSTWAVHDYMSDILPFLEFPGASDYDRAVMFCDEKNFPIIQRTPAIGLCPSSPSADTYALSTFMPSTLFTQRVREHPLAKPHMKYLDEKYGVEYQGGYTDYTVLSGCQEGIARRLGFKVSKGTANGLSGMFPFPLNSEKEALRAAADIMLKATTVTIERGLRPADISDGLSNTIMMAEIAGRPGHWRSGERFEADEPLDRPWADPRSVQQLNTVGSDTCLVQCDNQLSLYSFHPSGVHVLFGDGRVEMVSGLVDSRQILDWMTPSPVGEGGDE